MGNFLEPSIVSEPGISGDQNVLLNQLAGILSGGFQGFPGGAQAGLAQNLLGLPQADPDNVFQGFLAPSLRAFDQEIAPRIEEGFAQGGASFSSRRGETIARTLGDIQTQAQSQFITQNVPLQQILGQISGLGALFNPALGFSTAITRPHAVGQESPLTTTLGIAGTLAGKGE